METTPEPVNDPRWAAVAARDAAVDGQFVYAVTTTGVYCRPSCGARLPKPENVAFHATPAAAEGAGFRPCKRCRPDQPSQTERDAALVEKLCRVIENSEDPPTLQELADHAHLSPSHTRRLFQRVAGLTPRDYAEAHRAKRFRAELRNGRTVTDAIYEAGYSSSGRFYEQSTGVLGMTPTEYRRGGNDLEVRFALGECSLGAVLVAATRRGVCAILLGDDPEVLLHDLERRFRNAQLIGADPEFESTVAQVIGLVENPRAGVDLPLDVQGTAFQRRVWRALSRIPTGSTATYAEVARLIGAPSSARAVAQACAANRLAVAVPCHRVVRADGKLGGYRWGIDRKRELLAREAAAPALGGERAISSTEVPAAE